MNATFRARVKGRDLPNHPQVMEGNNEVTFLSIVFLSIHRGITT